MVFKFENKKEFGVFLVIFFSLYITPDFRVGGIVIPNFLPLVITSILLFLYSFTRESLRYFFSYLCLITVFLVIAILFSPEFSKYFSYRINGSIQIAFGFVIFSILALCTRDFNINALSNMFFKLFIFLFLFALLERIGLMHGISEVLRNIFYSVSLYDGFERDYLAYGFQRPMSLTKEPAHLAWLIALILFLLYKFERLKLVHVVMLGLVSFFILFSPIVFLLFFAIAADQFFKNKKISFIILPVVFFGFSFVVYNYFFFRVEALFAGSDLSTMSRLVSPHRYDL